MRLEEKEFKELKDLQKLNKEGKIDEKGKARLAELQAKKSTKGGGKGLKYNDYSWWSKYPELLKTALQLPMNHIPGTNLYETNPTVGTNIVGAVAHIFVNNYGNENDATDGVNMAFRKEWLNLHRTYRGIGTYESADLAITQIATIECICMATEIERIYGVINQYNVCNRNMPYTILGAMGVSDTLADNIRENLADFRYKLNVLLTKSQTMCTFKDMSILSDKISLLGNVFLDRDDVDAQAIVFTLSDIGVYAADVTPSGGSVEYMGYVNNHNWIQNAGITTWEGLLNQLEFRINSLVEDSDVQRQYSDMVAAYGYDKLLIPMLMPEDYKVIPVYAKEILHKVVNMEQLGNMPYYNYEEVSSVYKYGSFIPDALYNASGWKGSTDKLSHRITQFNNVVNTMMVIYDAGSYEHVIESTSSGNYHCYGTGVEEAGLFIDLVPFDDGGQTVLNLYEEPTDELILEGVLWKARNKVTVHRNVGEFGFVYVRLVSTSGPELFAQSIYYTRIKTATGGNYTVQRRALNTAFIEELDAVYYAGWSKFDWQPLLYDISSQSTHHVENILGELDNVRLVDDKDIRPIHRIAFMSSFKISD